MRGVFFVAALLAATCAATAYRGALDAGFCWDDHVVIEKNPALADEASARQLLSPSFWRQLRKVEGGARPVFAASLAADRLAFGPEPRGYHRTNLILHSANTALAVAAASALTGNLPLAAATGLLFGVHPAASEAVYVPSFRPDLLAAFFMLAALCAYLYGRSARGARRAAFWAGGAACWALALFSKETALVFPGMLLAAELLFPEGDARRRLWRAGGVLACSMVLGAAYWSYRAPRGGYAGLEGAKPLAMTADDANERRALPAAVGGSRPQWQLVYEDRAVNALTMTAVFADYARLLVWPRELRVDRAPVPIQSPQSGRFLGAAALLAVLGLAGVFAYRRGERPAVFGGLWLAASLVPVANFVPVYNIQAERYLYVGMFGACLAAARLFLALGGLTRARAVWATTALVAAAVLALGARTHRRSADWVSDDALFTCETALPGAGARAHYNLAVAREKTGALDDAEAHYRRALALNTLMTEANANLAVLLERRGDKTQARRYFNRTAGRDRTNPMALLVYAESRLRDGDAHEALSAFRRAVGADPNLGAAWLGLGEAGAHAGNLTEAERGFTRAATFPDLQARATYKLGMLRMSVGNMAGAETALREAVKLAPKSAEAALNLGVALHQQGKFPEAKRWLERAKALDARYPPTYYNLAVLEGDLGNLLESKKLLLQAVRYDPKYGDAYYNLGVINQRLESPAEAIAAYEKCLAVQPRRVEALNNLGGLYDQAGRLEEARRVLETAVLLDEKRASPHNNLGHIYRKLGLLDMAVGEFRRAIDIGTALGDPPESLEGPRLGLRLCAEALEKKSGG